VKILGQDEEQVQLTHGNHKALVHFLGLRDQLLEAKEFLDKPPTLFKMGNMR
jgi:hypothetical protein